MSNWGLGRQDESQIQPKLDRQPGQGTSSKGQGLRASIAVETEMLITGRSLAALVLLREHAGTCIPLSRYGHKVTNPESVRGAGECSFLAPMDISGRESTWPSLAVWFELESTDTELRKHKRRIGIQQEWAARQTRRRKWRLVAPKGPKEGCFFADGWDGGVSLAMEVWPLPSTAVMT